MEVEFGILLGLMIREQLCIYWHGLPSTLVDGLPNEKTELLLSRGGLSIRKYDGFLHCGRRNAPYHLV